MRFAFKPLTERDARQIAAWRYDEPYSFYDFQSDPDDLAELLDPRNWPGIYWAVVTEADELAGFFSARQAGEGVEIGLGLRPDLTGKGLGLAFVLAGLDFARARYAPARFHLAVATFNQRAIRVYEQAGFQPGSVFPQRTNGGEYEFLRMERAG